MELFRAVMAGDVSKVESLLSSGVKPNFRDFYKMMPLHCAATDNPDIVGLLLKHGADIEAMDHGGKIPLHFAASFGNARTADLLIKAGSNVNAKNNYGTTPLMKLADMSEFFMTMPGRDYVSVVLLLLVAGADINARDKDNKTALMDAAHAGNLVHLKLFVQHGADILAKCNEGKTAFDWADGECREWLLGLEKAGNDEDMLDELLSNDFPSGGKDGL